MVLAYFAAGMDARGNLPAATMARSMIKAFGDLPLTEAFLPEFIRAGEQRMLSGFFGREIMVPPPPDALLLTLSKATQIGWIHATPHYFPPITLHKDSEIPNWMQRPGDGAKEGEGFWEDVKNGRLESSSPTIGEGWMIVDETPKPEYDNGTQMYKNDPFAAILEKLREEGQITQLEHIPKGSRFGISHNELHLVSMEIDKLLGYPKDIWIRSLFAMEFNILHNIHDPNFGKDSATAEWLIDPWKENTGKAARLCGGAIDITYFPHNDDDQDMDRLGFRPVIVF